MITSENQAEGGVRKISFSEWKRKTMMLLVNLAASTSNEKERRDLTSLINELYSLRYKDIPMWLRYLWAYCEYHKRFDVCKEITSFDVEPS